jgi:hypothetical protein
MVKCGRREEGRVGRSVMATDAELARWFSCKRYDAGARSRTADANRAAVEHTPVHSRPWGSDPFRHAERSAFVRAVTAFVRVPGC